MHSGTEARARQQIRRAFPAPVETAPTPVQASAVRDIAELLGGRGDSLAEVRLDDAGVPEFDRRVYEVTRSIPPGSTMTYGAVAEALGEEPMRARDVGQALARNPFAPVVPCHRVVAADGIGGGYSAPGGADTKRRLLELEGAEVVAAPRQQALFD